MQELVKPKEKTKERIQFLWSLNARGVAPTRAVEALRERDGLSETRAWEIWREAKNLWAEEKPIEKSLAVSIVWHQGQDHLLRILQKLQENPNAIQWYKAVTAQLSTLADIAKACGPEVLDLNINANLSSHRTQDVNMTFRIEKILSELPEDEQRIAARILAQLAGLDPNAESGANRNSLLAPEIPERMDETPSPGDSVNRISQASSSNS